MAEKRDYYEVLGVERDADEARVSEAYRRLALKYHPDRNPGDDDAVVKFKEAAEAFEVLSHPEKRARYDRYGHAGLGAGAPQFRDVSDIFSAFGDIFGQGFFGDFFGGGRGQGAAGAEGRRHPLRADLGPDGGRQGHGQGRPLPPPYPVRDVRGLGAKPGTAPERCRYCGGRGRVVQSTGIFSLQTTCPSCHGAGMVIRDPCRECSGTGYVRKRVTRKVDIPPGVDERTQLRLPGEGEPSPDGGPPGDCYCFVRISDHPLFQRRGHDLFCEVPISYSQAALGATIEVPTLDGRENLSIPGRHAERRRSSRSRAAACPIPAATAAATCWSRSTSRCPKR